MYYVVYFHLKGLKQSAYKSIKSMAAKPDKIECKSKSGCYLRVTCECNQVSDPLFPLRSGSAGSDDDAGEEEW